MCKLQRSTRTEPQPSKLPYTAPQNEHPRNSFDRDGIDVSHHQGLIRWSEVASTSTRFSIIKISEGFSWCDPRAEQNWNRARAAGLLVGGYHFFLPKDGRKQARFFVRRLRDLDFEVGDILPTLDLEVWSSSHGSAHVYAQNVLDAIAYLRNHISTYPMVYTSRYFIRTVLEALRAEASENTAQCAEDRDLSSRWIEMLGRCPLWLASWNTQQSAPTLPEPWNHAAIWQYTATGRVQGIQGDVDRNQACTSSMPIWGGRHES